MSSFTNPAPVEQSDAQKFGDSPERVRETDHYEQEYIEQFVDRWDRLID